jgi:protein-L-isoaspartate(D-aspartate) O-methyltransferase
MERAAKLRAFFARFVATSAGLQDKRVEQAFATVPREIFLGPSPWFIAVPPRPGDPWESKYLPTPDDDPAFAYGNHLIALDPERGINNGEPTLHARCIEALNIQPGETVLHIGAGTGYYSSILAEFVLPSGLVHAFEIDPALAARAATALAGRPGIKLEARSGTAPGLPAADVIYVSAGTAAPSPAWLAALNPGGRLLFPLQPAEKFGAMLLVTKPSDGDTWPACFICRAGFIACQDTQDNDTTTASLAAAYAKGNWQTVTTLHLNDSPDSTKWYQGEGWWLGTSQ